MMSGEQLVREAIHRSPVSRGLAIVVANQHSKVFPDPEDILYGVIKDFKNTCSVFESLHYAVVPLPNAPIQTILDVITAVASLFPVYDDNDPRFKRIVFIFAGHGNKNSRIHTEDGVIDVKRDIMLPLLPEECPRLLHIPKLFFIDACRGTEVEQPIARGGGSALVYSQVSGMANYLLVQSALPFKKAFELDGHQGGYWTQVFLAELQKPSNMGRDIGYILIEVNRHVNAKFNLPRLIVKQHCPERIEEVPKIIQQAITENTLLDHVLFLDEAHLFGGIKSGHLPAVSPVLSTNEPSALGGQVTTSVAAGPVQQLGQSPQSRSGSSVSTTETPQAQGSTLHPPSEAPAPRGPITPTPLATPVSLASSHSVSPGPSASSTVSPVTELEQKLKEKHGESVVIEHEFKEERGGYRATLFAPGIGHETGTEVCASKSKAKELVAAEVLQSLD